MSRLRVLTVIVGCTIGVYALAAICILLLGEYE